METLFVSAVGQVREGGRGIPRSEHLLCTHCICLTARLLCLVYLVMCGCLLWCGRCPGMRQVLEDFWEGLREEGRGHGGLEVSVDASETVLMLIIHYLHSGLLLPLPPTLHPVGADSVPGEFVAPASSPSCAWLAYSCRFALFSPEDLSCRIGR